MCVCFQTSVLKGGNVCVCVCVCGLCACVCVCVCVYVCVCFQTSMLKGDRRRESARVRVREKGQARI